MGSEPFGAARMATALPALAGGKSSPWRERIAMQAPGLFFLACAMCGVKAGTSTGMPLGFGWDGVGAGENQKARCECVRLW